jgi:hypothetical protein
MIPTQAEPIVEALYARVALGIGAFPYAGTWMRRCRFHNIVTTKSDRRWKVKLRGHEGLSSSGIAPNRPARHYCLRIHDHDNPNTTHCMKQRMLPGLALAALLVVLPVLAPAQTDPLPSWSEGAAKKAIVEFVSKVTQTGSQDFVAVPERIAVFDNDGTLWAEQPMYVQMFFAMDQVKALAPQHPEWTNQEPFASLLKEDIKGAMAGGVMAMLQVALATHTGMTTTEFEQRVKAWLVTARHPRFKRPFTEVVYQPMLELLAYLRANGFKTFIVSGGSIDFMRPWTEKVYGIPPEQVVGSRFKAKFELRNGHAVLVQLPELAFLDDHAGKAVGIEAQIGRRPIVAFGNSDGDREMLEWTQAGGGPRLLMLVHHDDAEREWAYGPDSKIGTFSDSLRAEANRSGWTVISMKHDWKRIFAFEDK